jgi:rSAM/selenodomain-associated transferase 1
MRRALIVMAKGPRPGHVKTRLVPALGAGGAAGLYRSMLLDVLDISASVSGAELHLYVDPPESRGWFEEAAAGRFVVRLQAGESLAERMIAAFAEQFAAGARSVVMRGSDSPCLLPEQVVAAFEALERGADLVLAPDQGGGYALVGLREARPDLFRGAPMSTPSLLAETLRRARLYRLRVESLAPALDVDEPADLERLRDEIDALRGASFSPCERTAAFLAAQARPRKAPPVP